MAAPDLSQVERQSYLDILGIPDDPSLTLAELRSRTGGGVQADKSRTVSGLTADDILDRTSDLYATENRFTQIAANWSGNALTGYHVGETLPVGKSIAVETVGHNAFPGLAPLSDGGFLVVWRVAGQHNPGPVKGIIVAQKYNADGTARGDSYTVLEAEYDLRDPYLTLMSDGSIAMQIFMHDGGNTIVGVYVAISEDEGDTFEFKGKVPFTYDNLAASAGGVCEAPNGDWLVPSYGIDTTESFENQIRLMRSSDRGNTWYGELSMVGLPVGDFHHQEPVMSTLPDGTLMTLIRVVAWDNSSGGIYRTVSDDNGYTWSAPVEVAPVQGGRPAWISLRSGKILLVSRSRSTGVMNYAISKDNGVTWGPFKQIGSTPTSQGVYAQPIELASGLIGVAYGVEFTNETASVYFAYLADGSGYSPLGDDFTTKTGFPTDYALVDNFQRADSVGLGYADTGQKWEHAQGTTLGITGNKAYKTGGVVDLAVIDSGVVEGALEGDWEYTLAASGCAFIVKWVDINNYIFAGVETTGANVRLYKISNGALTQLASIGTQGMTGTVVHKIKITFRKGKIEVFVNGTLRLSYTLTATEYDKYWAATKVGIRSSLDGAIFRNFRVIKGFYDRVETITDQPELFISAEQFNAISGTITKSNVNGVGYPAAWYFDAAITEEIVTISPEIPPDWPMFDVVLWWTPFGVAAGDVYWSVIRNSMVSGSLVNAGMVSASVASTAPGVAGQAVAVTVLSKLKRLSGPLLLRIQRNGANASDTYTEDAGFLGIQLVRSV